MKSIEKMWLIIILKVTKNQGFTVFLEYTILENSLGGGFQTDQPPLTQLFKDSTCLKMALALIIR